MTNPIEVIKSIAKETDSIMLFHSAAGKDSICLLDMISPHFKKVICVHQYIVKDLEHIEKYIKWSEGKYKNCQFIQLPHYCLSSYRKYGHLGCEVDEKQKILKLSDVTDEARKRTGINWVIYGFKKSDSLNRRLMLMTYELEALNRESSKAYPLTSWKNGHVLKYIEQKRLAKPIVYGKGQSQGTAVDNLDFLLYCKNNYPGDYQKILKEFPEAGALVFEYEYHNS